MMHLSKSLLASVLTLFLAGCMATIPNVNPALYQRSSLNKNPYVDVVDSAKKLRVIVLPFDDQNIAAARQADVGNVVFNEVQSQLLQQGTAELVDRNLAPGLVEEMKLAEIQGNSQSFKGTDVADYAIFGSISDASLTSSFTEGYSWTDDDGKTHQVAPEIKYKGSVSGVLKIAKVGSGYIDIIRSIPFSYNEVLREETRYNNPKNRMDGLIRKAAIKAINDISTDIANQFAAKGYVIEKRVQQGKAPIFEIELGSEHGLKPGDKVFIYTIEENYNSLRNTSSREEVLLGEGVVTNQVRQSTCWIEVKDPVLANRIQMADYAKVHKEKGFWDKTSKLISEIQ